MRESDGSLSEPEGYVALRGKPVLQRLRSGRAGDRFRRQPRLPQRFLPRQDVTSTFSIGCEVIVSLITWLVSTRIAGKELNADRTNENLLHSHIVIYNTPEGCVP